MKELTRPPPPLPPVIRRPFIGSLLRRETFARCVASSVLLILTWCPLLSHGSKVQYTYDAAGRLRGANYDNAKVITFAYDLNGNLLERTTSMPTNADVRVSKVSDFAGITVGFDLNYTVTVSNAGPDAATEVQVADTLPFGMLFSGAGASQGTVSFSNRTVTGHLGTLAAGGVATLSLSAFHALTNSATNVATVASVTPDPDPGNNSDAQATTGLGPVFDSDGDGMANWWEERNDLNPFSDMGDHGADGDLDKDGVRNADEWAADTRANDPDSFPRIDALEVQPESASLFFHSSPIRLSTGESSPTLNPPAYTPFETIQGSGLPLTSVTDTNPAAARRFYRLEFEEP